MNNHQIEAVLANVPSFGGVYSRDNLPSVLNKPISLIVNTDSSVEAGEHWVAMHFPKSGTCEYFDPFGFPPLHNAFFSYINQNSTKHLIYSCKTVQHPSSQLCGTYCIEFVLARSRNQSYAKFLSGFETNTIINDRMLARKHKKNKNI